ncbi:MAG: hypothetical protein IJP70_06740 [Bacteroidales bacterium]|nr:hypothetical protein [Bacteroidales bacterium]
MGKSKIIISFFLLWFSFIYCSSKSIRKEILLLDYTIYIKVPKDFHLLESPYEEGIYILFFSPSSGSFIFLFKGGLVKLPLVNRNNSEIIQTKKSRRSYSEFGKRDSVYFRETLFIGSEIRAGYDHVYSADIPKFEKIVKSIKICKNKRNKDHELRCRIRPSGQ